MSKGLSYEEALEKTPFLIVNTIGTSMLPLIKEGENQVKLIKVNRSLTKGDVLLYKRSDGTYVLHRLIRIKRSGLVMCGDNHAHLEKGVKQEQVIAIMDGFFKGEEYIDINNKDYIKYTKRVLHTLPFRRIKSFFLKFFR